MAWVWGTDANRFQVSGVRCQEQRVSESINLGFVTILRPDFTAKIK